MASICTIVVTYNRRALLERCLIAIRKQSRQSDAILIVDNASTDSTQNWLRGWLPINLPNARLIAMDQNLGGAGGFATAMDAAAKDGFDWVWMMDDDAEPHVDALEQLLDRSLSPSNIYTSAAVNEGRLAWPVVAFPLGHAQPLLHSNELPAELSVAHASFLGILISTAMIKTIGLPDIGYFFQFDDVEYSYRARKAGANLTLVGKSRIEHPATDRYAVRFPGKTLYVFRMPPWKRYYQVRNRIFLAKTYHGRSAFYSTAPASFLRLVGPLIHEQHKFLQAWATIAGVIDGLLGRNGRRHEQWGLHP